MNSTKKFIQQHITALGPMTLEEYMSICLHHPEHGYYAKNNPSHSPIGAKGDFITAPEVGQVFGETVALWCISQWHLLGKPPTINLVELGPGNGTMMQDILRTFKSLNIPSNVFVHLVEISPVLRTKQLVALGDYQNINHYLSIDDIRIDGPTIIVANEFFDALPINQQIKSGDNWHTRMVGLDNRSELFFYPKPSSIHDDLDIFEESPASINILLKITSLLQSNKGACLIIDYGYTKGTGDTLQALYQHKPCSVFENPGNADLTAHVNFGKFSDVLTEKKITHTLATQSQFLTQFGAQERTKNLTEKNPDQKNILESALHRLTNNDKMGQLFKVLSFNVTT